MSVPLLVNGIGQALQHKNNDVRQWLPKGFEETRQYDWFLEHFGSEEMAVVSWPGNTLDDPKTAAVAKALNRFVSADKAADETVASAATVAADGSHTERALFKRVLTSQQAIESLTGQPMHLDRSEAEKRLGGLLVGPDGKTGGLIVMVNQAGAVDRKSALELIYRAAEQEAGLAREQVHIGGPTVDSVALDSESQRSRYLLTVISLTVALVLAWRCLKEVRLVAIVFATAILSAAISVALIHFTGGTMNLLLGMMPSLVYLLAISGAIHLTNYYRDSVEQGNVAEAPLNALRAGWLPCFLSALTTAIGMGSLATSEVVPVRAFGIYSALGVLATLPVLFVFLPAALHVFPGRGKAVQRKLASKSPASLAPRWTTASANWLIGNHVAVTVGCLVLMALTGIGLAKLDTSVKLLNLFSPKARIIQDYQWLEQNLGPLVPVEVVLHFDDTQPANSLERMRLVNEVQQEIEKIEKVGGTMSAATFAPPLPRGKGVRQVAQRLAFERRLQRSQDYFEDTNYVRAVAGGELWRVSARVEALNSLDYGHFVDRLKEQVEPVLQRVAENGGPRVEATYTGVVPLVYKAQRTLLNDLLMSFFTAFGIIAAVMVVLLRGVGAGLVSMLPNIFPATIMFGLMGLVGMLCDIGSMMTAGAAMGIAVDGTIHFLTWFRRALERGDSRAEAIRSAYENCATAMLQSTIICGMGILVFAWSGFIPTSRFAWIMSAMLAAALFGDLVMLPALLAGPLGGLFQPKPKVKEQPTTSVLVGSYEGQLSSQV